MARFTEKQLEEARKIIKPYTFKEYVESFNAKIPLCAINKADDFAQVNQFHTHLLLLCYDLFNGFKFKQEPLRKYIDETHKPALFVIWLQEDMPEIVKYCINKMKTQTQYQFILITAQNVSQYIDIPAHIQKYYDNNQICSADYSDYIRIKLLETYYGIYLDATCLLRDNIPEYVINKPYWSVKGDYQKNTNPIAMLHFHYGQVYALGGFDNRVYSYVRQMFDEYYKHFQYNFSYYMVYYFFEYAYLMISQVRTIIDCLNDNNDDCEQLAYQLDNISKLDNIDTFVDNFNYTFTFFYKLRSSDKYTDMHFKVFDKLSNI